MNTTKSLTLFSLAGLLGLLISLQASAQSYKQEADLMQNVWGMEKQALVKEYMTLNDEEGAAFWPVYEEYSSKRKEVGARRIDIIMDYANNYENMTNEKASELTKAVFKNNVQLEKLQQQYYKKMSKAIGALKATEFMQLEKYLDSVLRLETQENIPFLKELDGQRQS